jgi:hypothetical protein
MPKEPAVLIGARSWDDGLLLAARLRYAHMSTIARDTARVLALMAPVIALGCGCSSRGNVVVGGRCAIDESCATGVCLREARADGGVAWSQGYCSGNCRKTACPSGRCVELADGRSYCLAQCQGNSECRAGYVCSTAVGSCLPDCRLGWSCGAALECDAGTGTCMPPAPPPGTTALGAACTLNAECASNLCIPERRASGTVAWTGGACSLDCSSVSCPADSTCMTFADGSAYCISACAATPNCRTGYVCATAVGGCLPDCRLGWSCGTALVCEAATGTCMPPAPPPGTTALGAACTLNAECASGLCIPERRASGTVAWTGGTCSLDCSVAACPSGSTCVAFADGSAYCISACTTTFDCRTSYVCAMAVGGCLPDCRLGWSCGTALICDAGTGTCMPPTPPPGTRALGAACTLNAECASGLCIPERRGSGTVAWTGGTCSLDCSAATCPAGATCMTFADGSAYCVPACATASNCRTGYVCSTDIGGCLPDCRLGWSCGNSLVCDPNSGSCDYPAGTDAGVGTDAATDAVRGDGVSRDAGLRDARGAGPGPGPGGW